MSWTDEFINSLKQWDSEFTEKTMSIKDVCFMIGHQIGIGSNQDQWTLEYLKDRIQYLVEEERVREQFLVEALISEMSNFLTGMISGLGEAIINHEGMAKVEEDLFGSDLSNRKLDELKNKAYIFEAEEAVDVWNKVVSERFSLTRNRELENVEFQEHYEKAEKLYGSLSESDRKKTLRELRDEKLI